MAFAMAEPSGLKIIANPLKSSLKDDVLHFGHTFSLVMNRHVGQAFSLI